MGLDIRWPIGLMFTLIGLILVVFGFVTGVERRNVPPLPGHQRQHYWGIVLLIFGGWMLVMAWRGSKQDSTESKAG